MRLSLLGSSRKTNQECCIRIDDGRQRVEDPRALIPDVGDGGHQCGSGKNILYWGTLYASVIVYTQSEREREREIGTNRFCILFKRATVSTITTTTTTFTKGYKVTLYSDWLRATALYVISRNSLNLCDYGHYTLVFDKPNFLVITKTHHYSVFTYVSTKRGCTCAHPRSYAFGDVYPYGLESSRQQVQYS